MRSADEVESSLFHQFYLTDFCRVEGHCTQYTIIVRHTSTVEDHRLAVEHKALLCIEREGADTIFF